MKAVVTPEAENAIIEIARRHGLTRESVLAMLLAMRAGGGTMAQFSIPELGGSGQWMQGGMTMVGNMFDNALKARVDALCADLSQLLSTTTVFPAASKAAGMGFSSANWWPADLGIPSSTGGQNDSRYAVFPATRRLAIEVGGVTRVFDTAEHQIGGVQQQQGGGVGTMMFTSQLGTFAVLILRELNGAQVAEDPSAATEPKSAPQVQSQSPAEAKAAPDHEPKPEPVPMSTVVAPKNKPGVSGDLESTVAALESLAGLHQRGILTDEEFSSKKAELLGRL